MSDSQKRVKPSSVAAFLFMPQLQYSFQHFSFILPVFIRTVAIMFMQAGLLPRNHPAASYGAPDVRKYGFFELMGESWRNLRQSGAATPYQWGLFIGVCFMIGYVFLAAFQVLFGLSGMMIGSASAQLFNHPLGPTDISTIPMGSGGAFNHTVATSGGHADLGIMILDKILREGTLGSSGPGGYLQYALGSLMGLYNTAVLVLAGVLLFWAVLSVVVDTAKTGHVGGGRHNMVWAPIRIVFALGLLIPLGSSGFSSGQYMVMKLAEWGSNLGTRGWSTYVNTITTNNEMFVDPHAESMSPLIGQYASLWLCRTAYNAAAWQHGTLSSDQEIKPVLKSGVFDGGSKTWSFTNKTAENICGSIVYKTEKEPGNFYIALVGGRIGGGVLGPLGIAGGMATGWKLSKSIANYKIAVKNEYAKLFLGAGLSPGDVDGAPLANLARPFACEFVANHVKHNPGDPDPLTQITPACAGGYLGGYPDDSAIVSMTRLAFSTMEGVMGPLTDDMKRIMPQEMRDLAVLEGWTGMGRWYHQISSVNNAIGELNTPTVMITSGRDVDPKSRSSLMSTVKEVQEKYAEWWQKVPTENINNSIPTAGKPWEAPRDKPQSKGFWPVVDSLLGGGRGKESSGTGVSDALAGTLTEQLNSGYFLFDIADSSSNTYALAQLTDAGRKIVMMGVTLIGLTTGLQIVLGFLDATVFAQSFGSIGIAAARSVIIETFATLGSIIVMAGMMLTVYVPMIPLVRTVFSVLTWMTSVFEAVVMVPIAALAHLTTEGEGLAGTAKQAWILWLNVLMRPILTVLGYIAALLIFNTFVLYFHIIFAKLTMSNLSKDQLSGLLSIFSNTVIYVGIIYLAANSTFKLLDLMPNAMMKWIGGGQPDHSFDEHEATAGFISAGGQAASNFGRGVGSIGLNDTSRGYARGQYEDWKKGKESGVKPADKDKGKDN